MFAESITAGSLTTLLLEGIKWVVKKIKKVETFDFPTAFYVVIIPVLNALMAFPMFWLGLSTSEPLLGMTVIEGVKYVVNILLSSLVSLVVYNNGVKPLKEYNRSLAK